MSLAFKALWIMERNSNEQLSLGEVARACGVSRSHLAHAFGTTTGMPAMTYLRSRRLSRAATALAAGAPDILSVALDTGYGSHEAFTRAFRDEFGLTPDAVRERGTTDGLGLTEAQPLARSASAAPLRPRYEDQGKLRIVGLGATYTLATTIGIPDQWQRFMGMIEDIPHQIEDIPVGITSQPDQDGQFNYLCGIEVERFDRPPAGLETLTIPPARYAVFEHNGHVSGIYDTYDRIWNETLFEPGYAVADSPVVERHNPTFNPATGEGGVTIWVPMAATDQRSIDRNTETVAAYDRYAPTYAENTRVMSPVTVELLDAFAATLPAGAAVLEIGSGPGWDADYLESRGLKVDRTDAAEAFVLTQRARGKSARQLNLVTDSLGGPYDGVLMLYVVQHIDDDLLTSCLHKVAASLVAGGSLLLTFNEGEGSSTERGQSGNYHVTLRRAEQFRELLDRTGLQVISERQLTDDEGMWQAVLAQRR